MSNRESSLVVLHVLDILKKHSDEENILSMDKIIKYLEQRGIVRKRRAVGDTINQLIEFGYEISTYNENKKGYYLVEREFDKHEVRILVDAIASSKSITKKKSIELADKIYKLTSQPNGYKLKKQIYIDDMIKCFNEQIFINIDSISTAIDNHRKIAFNYFDYNVHKEPVSRKNGSKYVESPINIALNNGYYYLITYNSKHSDFTHYRIDRIKNIEILEEPLDDSYLKNKEYKNGFNVAKYITKTFNMFSGEESNVELKVHNSLLNMVIDMFGLDLNMYPLDEDHFKLIFNANISEGLLMWIMQFGSKVEVLKPKEIREKIRLEIERTRELYR